MNLFVVGWNLEYSVAEKLESVLLASCSVYPQLDPCTISCSKSQTAGNCLLSIRSADEIALPRRYLHSGGRFSVMFSGLPIDSGGRFEAHNAEELNAYWAELTECLEGQFSVVRLRQQPAQLELLTDPLGMEQVYYAVVANGYVFSNNVSVLSRALALREPDELGTSLYLMAGWAGSDRTLLRNIRTVPGGQLWSFIAGQTHPTKTTYFSISDCAQGEAKNAVEKFDNITSYLDMLKYLDQYFDPLTCGLTGGRDSRFLAALLWKNRSHAHFFTTDILPNGDSEVACEISRELRLEHQVVRLSCHEVLTRWCMLSERLVQQNDGMVSLWQIADIASQPQRPTRLKVMLPGVGGEIARSFYSSNDQYFKISKREQASKHLIRHALLKNCVVSQDAVELAQRYINEFVNEWSERDADPANIPDVFYAQERVRRWGGSNARKSQATSDRFPLFCSRPFIRAAFQLPPEARWNEQLHYDAIQALAPQILSIPFSGKPWRCDPVRQLPLAAQKSPAVQIEWLEKMRKEILDEVTADPASSLWEFVDKASFEEVMKSSDSQAGLRARAAEQLYGVATLFQYHQWIKNNL